MSFSAFMDIKNFSMHRFHYFFYLLTNSSFFLIFYRNIIRKIPHNITGFVPVFLTTWMLLNFAQRSERRLNSVKSVNAHSFAALCAWRAVVIWVRRKFAMFCLLLTGLTAIFLTTWMLFAELSKKSSRMAKTDWVTARMR